MKKTLVTFEAARPELLEEYRDVFLDSPLFQHYFSEDDRLRTFLRAALQNNELVAALCDGQVVGVMELRLKGFFGAFPYLALLGVKQGWRGKGIGRQMLAFFEEAARQTGCTKASLMVSHFNPRARRLYQNMGYKRIGFLPNAFKNGIDENILVKEL